jgi:hypothetical protein
MYGKEEMPGSARDGMGGLAGDILRTALQLVTMGLCRIYIAGSLCGASFRT